MYRSLKPFTYVLVRDTETDVWVPDIFCKYYSGEKNIPHPYGCFRSSWTYCIPYEGNEHLAFTTGSTYNPEFGDIILFPDNHDNMTVGIVIRISGRDAIVVPRDGAYIFYTRAINKLKPFKAEL